MRTHIRGAAQVVMDFADANRGVPTLGECHVPRTLGLPEVARRSMLFYCRGVDVRVVVTAGPSITGVVPGTVDNERPVLVCTNRHLVAEY